MTARLDFPLRLAGEADADVTDDAPLEPEPAIELAGPATAGPLVAIDGDRMTWRDDMAATVRHALAVARHQLQAMRERDGGIVHGLMNGQPPSVRQQCDYAANRAWLAPGTDGGTLEGMGVIYHALAGKPGVAIGDAISAVHARPVRWCIATVLAAAAAVILLAITGHALAAWIAGLAVLALAGLWAGAGWLLMRIRRPTIWTDDATEED